MYKYLLIVVAAQILTGCEAVKVKPWERGDLSQAIMQPATGLDKSIEVHTFLSKEASTGGNGVAAGGCGCN